MNDREHEQENDRAPERSLRRDLRDLSRLQPEATDTARAIQRARAAIGNATSYPPAARKRIMTLRNVGAIAAALLAMALFKYWTTPELETGFAFGAVQKEVEKTKSVQYVQKRKDSVDGRVRPEETRKVMIRGPHQMREEVETTSAGDPPPEGQIRLGAGPDKYTMVRNVKTGKTITLYPDKKTYSVPKLILGIDRDSGEIKESKIEPAPHLDFYQRIREFPSDSATKLPDRKINGRTAIGFQTVDKKKRRTGDDTWTRTYWIDPETKLPVRIEVVNVSVQGKSTVTSEFVKSDIIFDAPLDEALFSTDPPEGYKDSAPAEPRREELEKSKQ
jgi:outer membrane lipoprotein-sorting protein